MLLSSFVVFTFLCQVSNTYIVKLAIVHRHGDRTPNWPWTGAPIANASEWPEGWYQETLPGKRRLYRLGQYFRRGYPTIITNDPTEVLVRSSQRRRTIMSTQSLLAGAFPPSEQYQIYPDLKWQPIPILIDDMLREGNCPEADIERQRLQMSDPEVIFNEENKEFYQFLTERTGRNVTVSDDVDAVRDRIKIAQDLNKASPSWATDEVMEKMENISSKEYYFAGRSIKQQRLRTGLFFKDLLSQFSNPWGKKFLVYSTHDAQMAIMMNVMNSYPDELIKFGSSLIFELHSHESISKTKYPVDNFFVKIFYMKNTYSKELKELTPLGCDSGQNCLLSQFANALQPIVINDWKHECGFN